MSSRRKRSRRDVRVTGPGGRSMIASFRPSAKAYQLRDDLAAVFELPHDECELVIGGLAATREPTPLRIGAELVLEEALPDLVTRVELRRRGATEPA